MNDNERFACIGREIVRMIRDVHATSPSDDAYANQWQSAVATSIQEYMDERSEKWQESDKGQQYESWRQEYEEELATVELEKPDDLSISDVEDVAEILSNRNESLGGE